MYKGKRFTNFIRSTCGLEVKSQHNNLKIRGSSLTQINILINEHGLREIGNKTSSHFIALEPIFL